jgi:hypothetical protein
MPRDRIDRRPIGHQLGFESPTGFGSQASLFEIVFEGFAFARA